MIQEKSKREKENMHGKKLWDKTKQTAEIKPTRKTKQIKPNQTKTKWNKFKKYYWVSLCCPSTVGMRLGLKSDLYVTESPLKNINFSFAGDYWLEIISG